MESLNDLIWSDEESEISTLTIDTKPIMRHACMVCLSCEVITPDPPLGAYGAYDCW